MKADSIQPRPVFYPTASKAPEVLAALDRLTQLSPGLFSDWQDAIERTPDGVNVDWTALQDAHVHDTTRLPFLLVFSSLDSIAAGALVDENDSFLTTIGTIGSCDGQELPVISALGGLTLSASDFGRSHAEFTRNLAALIQALRIKTMFKIERPIRSQYSIEPNPSEFRRRMTTLKHGSACMAASIFALYNSYFAFRELTENGGYAWNPNTPEAVGRIWTHGNPENVRLWFRTLASYSGW